MRRWFPSINVWVWSLLFAILVFVLNILTVKFFAESEFWFASIKVIAIVLFIVVGAAAMVGSLPMTHFPSAPFFSNFTSAGLFPNGAFAIVMTMLAVNFAFSGTELIGIAAETANPEKRYQRPFVLHCGD